MIEQYFESLLENVCRSVHCFLFVTALGVLAAKFVPPFELQILESIFLTAHISSICLGARATDVPVSLS